MKINEGKNYVELTVERVEDLFILYLILKPGDLVYSWTVREVRGRSGERFGREKVYLGVRVRDLEFHEPRGVLRIRGIIEDYPEWLEGAGGSYHSLEVGIGSTLKIMRSINRDYLEQLINTLSSGIKVLIVSVSIEETTVALATRLGVSIIATISNNYIQGKESGGSLINQRYIDDVSKVVRQLTEVHKPNALIIATQGMLMSSIPDIEVKGVPVERVIVSEGGLSGIYEVERRGYLDKVGLKLGYDTVNRIMEELSKGSGLVALGDEIYEALSMGAVDSLVMLDKLLIEKAEESRRIIDDCIRTRAKLIIVPDGSEAGKLLNGLGGLAALLRFRIK
ncbi:pelota family protein [Caldivirga maquilingensis]|nr:pelota family protein [Caldivirga maquilingensis]